MTDELTASIEQVRQVGRELGFIRGLETAAVLARKAGHVAMAEQFLNLCFYDGLVHLERDARTARAEELANA